MSTKRTLSLSIKTVTKRTSRSVRILVDRLQLLAWLLSSGRRLPEIPGYVVERDSLVRQQTSIKTYRRVRIYRNRKTNTTIYLQYDRACPWLAPAKLTIVSRDRKGLCRSELESIARAFKRIRLLTVEVAFDFSFSSGVNREFVLRHGIFGRSRLAEKRPFNDLRFGTRHSDTMVRAYEKPELRSYRVELELHSKWLRRTGIVQPRDLSGLPGLLVFRRIKFVAIDWDRLETHLLGKGHSASLVSGIRSLAYSLHHFLTLLRNKTGLVNVQRFLFLLPVNELIRQRLSAWGKSWRNSATKPGRFHD